MNKEVITIEDSPGKETKHLIISIETPVVKTYQIEQVEAEVQDILNSIESENKILTQYQLELIEKQELLVKLNNAMNNRAKN